MIVAGTVTYKMAEVVRRIYDQMGDPKWLLQWVRVLQPRMYRSYAVAGSGHNRSVDVYVVVTSA